MLTFDIGNQQVMLPTLALLSVIDVSVYHLSLVLPFVIGVTRLFIDIPSIIMSRTSYCVKDKVKVSNKDTKYFPNLVGLIALKNK